MTSKFRRGAVRQAVPDDRTYLRAMRQAVKILLISGLFIMVIGGLGIYAMISKFSQDVEGIQ